MAIIDRERELEALATCLTRPASMSLVYGQRRVGKTFLLQHLVADVPRHLYFLADESTASTLLHRFHGEVAASGLGGALWETLPPTDWGTSLTLLVQSAHADGGLVLVLDELQYLLEAEPALPSILQRLWDTFHPRGGLHFVLCGSALGTLARLGDQGQPLHGRFDLRMQLRPFHAHQAVRFLPGWPAAEAVRAYGVFGGLARHLAEIHPAEDLGSNVRRAILDSLGALHEAPLDVLRTEHLGSHADASALLAAVAAGENRFSAIAARTGLAGDRVARVADELIALEILERQHRYGDRPGSRYTRYRCVDPFTTFWFRYVQPNRSALAAGAGPVWSQRVAPRIEDHMGHVFEDVVRQAIQSGVPLGLPGPVDEVAPWWSRDGQTELDLVVRSGDAVAYVECKWRAGGEVTRRDLARLRGHLARFAGTRPEHRLALATAGRFSDDLRQIATAEGVVLLGLDELLH